MRLLTLSLMIGGCIVEPCEDAAHTGSDTGTELTVTDTGGVTDPPIQDCTTVLDVTRIDADLTITADCVTEIRNYIDVDNDAVLTIEAGARLAFATEAGLGIHRARILIEGTAAAPVVLTSADTKLPGTWTGIHFESETLRGNVVRHAIFEYGGAQHSAYTEHGVLSLAWVTAYEPDTFVLEDSVFRHNLYGGVGVWSVSGGTPFPGQFTSFARNTFMDNGGVSIRLPCTLIADIGPDNVLDEPVRVATHWLLDDRPWPDLGQPYVIEANLNVAAPESELHIDGLELQFERGTSLEVTAGAMFATGTTFTSAAQTPMAGDWGGIEVSWVGVAVLEDGVIEYVGSGSYETLGFQNDSALYSTVTGMTFRNNAGASNVQAQDYCGTITAPEAGNTFDLVPCVR